MLTPPLLELRRILHAVAPDPIETRIEAATYACRVMHQKSDVTGLINASTCDYYLNAIIDNLLHQERYDDAAYILWPPSMFTLEPESSRRVWNAVRNNTVVYILGAGSMGKSFTLAVYFLLDWRRDPLWTSVKCVSVTGEHAKRNVFAHIKMLHEYSLIPMPGERTAHAITASDNDKQGIHLVAIPKDSAGDAVLRGFHPAPRPGLPHPTFGTLSRVNALIDEAEEVPPGVWAGVDNMLITVNSANDRHVKVASATNPKDMFSEYGYRTEPLNGWTSVDMDYTVEWASKKSGHLVIRLDGARCENVVQQKEIYPGLLSFKGYLDYQSKGIDAPEYSTMARGMFPLQGVEGTAIPPQIVEGAKGKFQFRQAPKWCLSVDPAFEGGDRPIMALGRYGLVEGYYKAIDGMWCSFPEPRWGLQVEQIYELKNRKTETMADEIHQIAKDHHIPADMIIIDRTGNGTGVFDRLKDKMGNAVVGIHYGEEATQMPIFMDDSVRACDLYKGIPSEMHFAVRRLMEYNVVKLGPALQDEELVRELSTRRYRPVVGGLLKIEPKPDYKSRGKKQGGMGKSPDKADSLSLLVHLVRIQMTFEPVMDPESFAIRKEETPAPSFYPIPTMDMSKW